MRRFGTRAESPAGRATPCIDGVSFGGGKPRVGEERNSHDERKKGDASC